MAPTAKPFNKVLGIFPNHPHIPTPVVTFQSFIKIQFLLSSPIPPLVCYLLHSQPCSIALNPGHVPLHQDMAILALCSLM